MHRVTTVPPGQSRRRLDVFVSGQSAHVSRATAQRWIASGVITVNGRPAKPAQRIRPGDVIVSHVPARERPPVDPEPIPLSVLHEDSALAVVNKPPGLVMHPAPGHWTGTLLNALVHHMKDAGRTRPGLVHRLDKGTSGVLVIAKTDAAHRDLSRQFHAHSVERMYLALVAGPVRGGGLIDAPLGRDARDGRRVSARSARPRRAVTEFRVAERLGPEATLLEVRPRTGRMHQIRAHLASIGHPLLGDRTYGAALHDPDLTRPMLHAAALGFVHPTTGERAVYRAPLPPDMERALARRRRPGPPLPSPRRTQHMASKPISACTGILAIWNDMDAEHEDFYEQWYMSEHFPERLGVPGFRRGRRYEAVEADRRYFSFYELDDPDVLFSPAYLARLGAPTAWTQRIMRVWKGMVRTACERVERTGHALGGYVVAARWEAPAVPEPGIADRTREALADPSVVAVDVWRACERQNAPTREAETRGTPDRLITAAMVVEATRLSSASRAVALLPTLLADLPAPRSLGLYRLIALEDSEA